MARQSAGGAQRESGDDTASIGNAASGDDRDSDRIEGLGQRSDDQRQGDRQWRSKSIF